MAMPKKAAWVIAVAILALQTLVQAQIVATTTDAGDAAILLNFCNTLQPNVWKDNCSKTSVACTELNSTSAGVKCDSGGRVTKLYMVNQNLTGTIPSNLGDLTWLDYMTLTTNNLTGTIPSSLSKLVHLTHLFISENPLLTGPIPPELGNLPLLYTLGLHSNDLTGTVPASLCNLVGFSSLALHGNQLTGTIPACLADLKDWDYLSLASNQLSGTYPAKFATIEFGNLLLNDNPNLGGVWLNTPFNVPDPSRCNVSVTSICQCNATSYICGSTWTNQFYTVPKCSVESRATLYPWYQESMCFNSPTTGGVTPSGQPIDPKPGEDTGGSFVGPSLVAMMVFGSISALF